MLCSSLILIGWWNATVDDRISIPAGQYTYSRLAQLLSTPVAPVKCSSKVADRVSAVSIKLKPRVKVLSMLEKGLDITFDDQPSGGFLMRESDAARIGDAQKLATYNKDYEDQLKPFLAYCAQQVFPVPGGPSLADKIHDLHSTLNEASLTREMMPNERDLFNYVSNFNSFAWLWVLRQKPNIASIQESPILIDEDQSQIVDDSSYPEWLRSFIGLGDGPPGRFLSDVHYDPYRLCLGWVEAFYNARTQDLTPMSLPGFSCDSTVVTEDSDPTQIPKDLLNRIEATKRFLHEQGGKTFKQPLPNSEGLALLEWAKESDSDLVAEISGIRGPLVPDRGNVFSLKGAFDRVKWLWDPKADEDPGRYYAWFECAFQTSMDMESGVLFTRNELRFLDNLVHVPYSKVESLIDQPGPTNNSRFPTLASLKKIASGLSAETLGQLAVTENQDAVRTIALLSPLLHLMSALSAPNEQAYWQSLQPAGAIKIPMYLFARASIDRFVSDWRALVSHWHGAGDVQVLDPEFMSDLTPYSLKIEYHNDTGYLTYSVNDSRTQYSSICYGAGHVRLP